MTKTPLLALLLVVAVLTGASTAGAATNTTAVSHIALSIKSDTEHAKKGPDGKWHDAFLPASMTVKAGAKTTVTIRNYDTAAHAFYAKALGLDVKLRAGSATKPSTTTFTFTAPRKGTFTWVCMLSCDPWAMSHLGYMRGRITAV